MGRGVTLRAPVSRRDGSLGSGRTQDAQTYLLYGSWFCNKV